MLPSQVLASRGQSSHQQCVCSGSDNDTSEACEFFYSGYCGIRLRTFNSDDRWTTGSLKKKSYLVLSNSSQEACARQMIRVGHHAFEPITMLIKLITSLGLMKLLRWQW